MSQTSNNLASESWAIADLLRGDFKQSQYGRIILPFCLLRRLECVLEPTKEAVLVKFQEILPMNLPEEAHEKMLLRATNGLSFFNTSKMDLSKLGETGIKANLENYIQGFSKDAREIFEHFKFMEFVSLLNDANLLYKVVQKIRTIDLSPKAISNHDMGLVFEELIRRFAEGSNETAGEHFTPRDIVRLTTSLVFMEDDEALTKPGIIRTIYDPTAGTGGFLSAGMEYVHELNPQAVMRAYGQELNPESYAICKADMLIKGQEVGNIKLGNTLSNDHLYADKFDYMLSNPPFGVDWKKIESDIQDEHKLKGFDGRFGAGLPRVSDGSLLFLLHLISKLRGADENGGRIGIILNGSPLFTGGAGSGESEIRRYILEADLLEAIVALPTDMFYNTGIATYIWILSNKKSKERKGKVQLINGTDLCSKMRKSLGSKRNWMDEGDIATITRCFGDFEAIDAYSLDKAADVKSNRGRQSATPKADIPKTFASKIFATHEFGYRRITIERPLRLSAQFTSDAIASLRFANGALKPVMEWIYQHVGDEWTEATYGQLGNHEDAIRTKIKKDFADIKEKQIKDVLDSEIWLAQKALMEKAQALHAEIGDAQHDDFNEFDKTLTQAQKTTGIKLDAKEQKQLLDALTWKNPEAEPIVKKVLKDKEDSIYGKFTYKGKVVEFETDGDLRDNENVPLNPKLSVNEINEAYFKKEVEPHVKDAWINPDKRDDKDKEIGIVGYEIPFNRHFYVYQPPRKLEEIDADLDAVTKSIFGIAARGAFVMGRYQAYPEYKDSKVEWLGDVPAEWEIIYGKRIFRSVREAALQTDEQLAASQKYGVVPQSLMMELNDSKVMLALKGTESFRHVEKENFVISLRSFEGGIEHSNYAGCVSPAYTVLSSSKSIVPRFYKYLFKSQPYISALQSSTDSLRDGKSISYEQFGRIQLISPRVDEQQAIANFLDHETAKIDTLIEQQQQLIQLLKEKREAVISHAVTKGLVFNAPMKDSGVEWLGEVPEHWEVKQAKYIADITRGAILRPVDAPEYFDEDGEWAYLNISDATSCDKYLYDSKLKLSPLGSTKSARVYPDNLIITASATIGKAFINKIKVCVHDGFIPFCNIKMDINYLYHYLSNPFLYAAMGKSNTQKNIYLDEVKNMTITIPPLEEQIAIVAHIESNSEKFNALIALAEKANLIMQERRTALISAAVTGMIDVRNWQAPQN